MRQMRSHLIANLRANLIAIPIAKLLPRLLPRLIAACFCLSAWICQAEQRIDHLYEARIPIQSRLAADQEIAIQAGLASVLNKISGYSNTSGFPELESGLADAGLLVSEFAIQTMSIPTEDNLTIRNTDALYMRFLNSGVDQLIREFEIPVWPATRPQILLLVAIELGGQPQLLTEETHPAAYAVLKRAAFDRGLNLTLLDASTLQNLSVSSDAVWDLDRIALDATFALLPIDSIAVIRLGADTDSEAGSQHYGDLNLVADTDGYTGQIEGQNFTQALTAALDEYIDELSLTTAFVASGVADTRVLLEVSGTPGFAAFNEIRDYLRSLEQIENAKLLRLSTGSFVFQLEFQSGLELLRSSLNASGLLVEMTPDLSDLSQSTRIRYQYRQPLYFPLQESE